MSQEPKTDDSPTRDPSQQMAAFTAYVSESPPHKKVKTAERSSPDSKSLDGLNGWYMK